MTTTVLDEDGMPVVVVRTIDVTPEPPDPTGSSVSLAGSISTAVTIHDATLSGVPVPLAGTISAAITVHNSSLTVVTAVPLAGTISVPVTVHNSTLSGIPYDVPLAGTVSVHIGVTGGLTVSTPTDVPLAGSISIGLDLSADTALSQILEGEVSAAIGITGDLRIKGQLGENAGIEVRLYDKTGTVYLQTLERAVAQWQEENSKPGSASFSIPIDDPKLEFITDRSIVKFSWLGKERFACVVTSEATNLAVDGQVYVKFDTQPGILSLLSDAVVYPEFGLYKDNDGNITLPKKSPKDRLFGYMSLADNSEGSWYNPKQWVRPAGTVWTTGPGNKKNSPENLRIIDQKAQWIAVGSTTAYAPAGEVQYFRTEFTLDNDLAVQIYATGDNDCEVYLDGQLIISPKIDEPLQWYVAQLTGVELAKGTHTLAAKVRNATEDVKRGGVNQDGLGPLIRTPIGPSPIAFIADVVYLSESTKQPAQYHTTAELYGDVNFALDSSRLTAAAINALNTIVTKIGGITNPAITVVGHASTDGDADHNMTLSIARANSVKAYLLTKKPGAVITASGEGENNPKYSPGTSALNRRVDITFPRSEPGVSAGDVWSAHVIRRTDTTNWWATNANVGWYRAQVLRQLVLEAQQRDVLGPSVLNLGFSPGKGTDLKPWNTPYVSGGKIPLVGQYSFTIGQTHLLDICEQLCEADLDVWCDASTMELRAATRRGQDRTTGDDAVRLWVGGNLTATDSTRTAIKSTLVVAQQPDGTYLQTLSPSFQTTGRIEVGLQIGSVTDNQTAVSVTNDFLTVQGKPLLTFTGKIDSSNPNLPIPYRDFDIGDTVLIPAPRGHGAIPARVLSITVDGTGNVVQCWAEFAFDPMSPSNSGEVSILGVEMDASSEGPRRLPITASERLQVVVNRMAGGSAAGSTRFAKPIDNTPLVSDPDPGTQVYFDSDRYPNTGPDAADPGDFWVTTPTTQLGSISGTTMFGDGADMAYPFGGRIVRLVKDGATVQTTTSGEGAYWSNPDAGKYSFANVAFGNYTVEFDANTTHLYEEPYYYPGTQAASISVTVNGDMTNIDPVGLYS